MYTVHKHLQKWCIMNNDKIIYNGTHLRNDDVFEYLENHVSRDLKNVR